MKKYFAVLALFVGAQAYAIQDGQYTCTVSPKGADKSKVEIGFTLKKGDIACVKGEGEDSCEEWFTYAPAEQKKFWLDGLYDGGFGDTDKGDWEVSADSDGCNVANLTLYKNSGFTKGFITTEFRCGSGETERYAGSVSCKRK